MQFLIKEKKSQIQDMLCQKGLLSPQVLVEAEAESLAKKEDVFDYLMAAGSLDEEELVKVVCQISNIPYINLSNQKDLNSQTLELLPRHVAQEYMAIPLGVQGHKLVVAMMEADNVMKVDYLSQLLGYPLSIFMASKSGIHNALRQYEVKIKEEDILSSLNTQQEQDKIDKEEVNKNKNKSSILSPFRNDTTATDIASFAAESPASQALNNILHYAVSRKASDIHVEGMEHDVRIRIRIDGVLIQVSLFPKALEAPLIAKIKICAQLKVDEKRLPQDGEFVIKIYDNKIDLRVAISPTIWGEQVIMRILDRSGLVTGLEQLGYCGQNLQVIREALKQSSGMILTSGPTGSGKTTSLYTLLQEVLSDSVKIITLEDPPEYKINGVNQIPVNKGIGLTFSVGLRSILRQDPDIIMVGEIRDQETASLAIQASLTGHLVFSTLHTNSAAGILPRLLDMGIEPFLISSTVRVVIGQRLVRRNTEDDEEYKSSLGQTQSIQKTLQGLLPAKTNSPQEIEKINEHLGYANLPFIDDEAYTLYRGEGNREDPNAGYKGRIGIYEAFAVSDVIQQLIIQRATSTQIQTQAQKEGMVIMRQDGYLKALAGITTTLEIDRVIDS